MEKLLSVIVPSYNMESYLGRCLESLVLPDKDAFRTLEVLVINDGSTDKTHDIAADFARRFPETFRVIDKTNGHYGSCINRGLKEATGIFVKILDADDLFDTEGLKDLLSSLGKLKDANNKIDAVLTRYQKIDSDGKTIATTTAPFKENQLIGLDEFTSSPFIRQMHAITYRKSIFNRLDYVQTEGIAYTDSEWIFLPFTNVRGLINLPVVVYKYLIGREGQSVAPEVFIRQLNMFHKTFQSKASEYATRADDWSPAAKRYAESQLAREMADLYFMGIKTSNKHILADLDGLLNSTLKPFRAKVGYDGVLFVNPIFKFLFAKGCCQHRWFRPFMKKLIEFK